MLLRLTFWHPVNVHIEAQHDATQPKSQTWPHQRHCKHDPCNTKPGLGLADPGFLHRSVPAQWVQGSLSLMVGPGKLSRASLALYRSHGTRSGTHARPPPLTWGLSSSYLSPALPQRSRGGTSPHQGREESCCCGQSHRCRRYRMAGWAHHPRPAGSVPQTLSPPRTDAWPPCDLSSCCWRRLGPGPRWWEGTGKPRNPVTRSLRDDKTYYDHS